MECGYAKYVGGVCGASRYNPRVVECISVTDCDKDIRSYLKSIDVREASLTEANLLFARAGLFRSEDVTLTICPRHREIHGVRWRSQRRNCACPPFWSAHQKPAKVERGITTRQSEMLYVITETLIPVGTGICTRCRKRLDEALKDLPQEKALGSPLPVPSLTYQESPRQQEDVLDLCESFLNLSIHEDEYEAEHEASIYIPEETSSSADSDDRAVNTLKRREYLNRFLEVCDVAVVGAQKKAWEKASSRTQKSHIVKARDAIVAVLEVITPGDSALLWEAVRSSGEVEKALGLEGSSAADDKYLRALAETYENASSWDTRRQVLSVMADLVPFKRLQTYLPDITEYRFKIARQHKLLYGRGAPLPKAPTARTRVDKTQLDHFLNFITSAHIIQDLPFGQRYLHLSSGEILETPNVIRAMIPERIVKQYNQYCKETGFTPFGRTTMLKILSECSATIRKSLQGLDYIAADGSKAFDDLCSAVRRLEECGAISRECRDNWQTSLKTSKQYLKSDYKVHVSRASAVPDHCSTFALSDGKEGRYSSSCDHIHDQACSQCELLENVMVEVLDAFKKDDLSIGEDELIDLRYTSKKACKDVRAWKAHQLRSTRQDEARLDVLQNLNQCSILMTNDWAMKFLPQKYRESQSDWFAKRGISWHISVVNRKVDGALQTQTFVHIVTNCTQDAPVVIRIVEHILRTLNSEEQCIKEAFVRQDNAGCYHSSVTLAACCFMKSKTGIGVSRADFSDPQGGKGPCDRMAATIKAHVRRYINEGSSVTTAQELRDAILSSGGLPGVRVALVDGANLSDDHVKWDGISLLHNFQFSKGRITMWKAYEVGSGRIIRVRDLKAKPFKGTFQERFTDGGFVRVSRDAKRIQKEPPSSAAAVATPSASSAATDALPTPEADLVDDGIFPCSNEGCIKVYQSYAALQNHLLYGKCELREERLTLMDKAKILYREKLLEGTSATATTEGEEICQRHSERSPLTKGWALKSSKSSSRFNEAQRKYLEEKFAIGQATGHKAIPAQVSRDMRYAKKPDGERMFQPDEFLTETQIQGFFSRHAARLRHQYDPDTDDEASVVEETNFAMARATVLQTVGLEHPICHDQYNLCDMHKEDKLNKLSVKLLQDICADMDIDTSTVSTAHRKAPYIVLLSKALQECSCCK